MRRRRFPSPVLLRLAAAVSALAVLGAVAGPSGARAESLPNPVVGSVEIAGRGYGHGIGMSQWGAQGAALAGLTWAQILDFYYPGTTRSTQADPSVRVGLTVDGDGVTEVLATSSLRVQIAAEAPVALPAAGASRWRIVVRGTGLGLDRYDPTARAWVAWAPPGRTAGSALPSPVRFSDSAGTVRLVLPTGTARELPDAVGAVRTSTSLVTVNDTSWEQYVSGVVVSEVPTSWHANALRAQAVAARTYAAYEAAHPRSSSYDVCDTTACQMYRGLADYTLSGALVADYRNSAVSAAAAATKGVVLTYGGAAALTMFSAANGGWTAAGNVPYLPAKADPYDGRVAGTAHAWTISGSTGWRSKIEAAYPSVGSLRQLLVTRDGNGLWGGRIVSVTVVGTAGRVTGVSGPTLRSILGVRSAWFTLTDTDHLRRDVTLDGVPDVFAVSQWGTMFRVPGRAGADIDGTFGSPVPLGSNWQTVSLLTPAGDLDANGRGDLFGRVTATGERVCYSISPSGTIAARTTLGGSWSGYGALVGAGDLSGDGRADFLAVSSSGHLELSLGDGASCGGRTGAYSLGGGWAAMDLLVPAGDANGDGFADLFARESATGALWLYPGTGQGRFGARVRLGLGWNAMTQLTPVGDLDGAGGVDVLARAGSGEVWLYPGLGSGVPRPRVAVSLHPSLTRIT